MQSKKRSRVLVCMLAVAALVVCGIPALTIGAFAGSTTVTDAASFVEGGNIRLDPTLSMYSADSGTSYSNSGWTSDNWTGTVFVGTMQYDGSSTAVYNIDRSATSATDLSSFLSMHYSVNFDACKAGRLAWYLGTMSDNTNGHGSARSSINVTGANGGSYTYSLSTSYALLTGVAGSADSDYGMSQTPHTYDYDGTINGTIPNINDTVNFRLLGVSWGKANNNCYYESYQWINVTVHSYCSHSQGYTYSANGNGTHTRTCKTCGQQWTDSCSLGACEQYNASQHRQYCSVCGGYTYSAHNFTTNVVAPTCTSAGYTVHTCSSCGYSYTDTPTAALGHNYGPYVTTTAPTSTSVGVQTATCANDSSHTLTRPCYYVNFPSGSHYTISDISSNYANLTASDTCTFNLAVDPGYGRDLSVSGTNCTVTGSDGSYSVTSFTGVPTVNVSFQPNTYTVSYDANGGTGAPDGFTATYDTAYTAGAAPTKTGYTFTGWLGSNGTTYQAGDELKNTSRPTAAPSLWLPSGRSTTTMSLSGMKTAHSWAMYSR